MRILFYSKTIFIVFALLVVGIILFFILRSLNDADSEYGITTTVEQGDVMEIVSVSGVVEADNKVSLSFPATGVTQGVFVTEGTEVKEGDVLVTLASRQIIAERERAVASIRLAEADYEELLAGREEVARKVTEESLKNLEATLERTIEEEDVKVANTRALLYSSNLEAIAVDANEDATPPTVTGTYICEKEGDYVLSVYSSNSNSGYSFRLNGLELGTYTVYTDQPSPLGECGLFIQFDADSLYSRSEWRITIPNTRSATYVTNYNAYQLAVTQRENAIKDAEEALSLAQKDAERIDSSPRDEAITRAQARVDNARASLAEVNARMEDRSIVAPFDGTITNIEIREGELANLTPVITLLANEAFELTIRIPEIDITKIQKDQEVTMRFDASTDELLSGSISFVSPLAVEIDGVAYFEAKVQIDQPPSWMRSGLNADVDIIIKKRENVLRLPKRFVSEGDDGTYFVTLPVDGKRKTDSVDVAFIGNDGFVEITGLTEGTTVLAP